MSLRDKKLAELREIATSIGVKFTMSMSKDAIAQAIELAQVIPVDEAAPVEVSQVSVDEDDPIFALLNDHVAKGLFIRIDGETVYISRASKEDSFHISTPDDVVLRLADAVLRG